jgi:hypothetical protein
MMRDLDLPRAASDQGVTLTLAGMRPSTTLSRQCTSGQTYWRARAYS